VRAFAGAAGLPSLSGAAPFGGDILSHDFVEAAWLRRAGWGVEIDPDSRGSAEGGPETLSAYHKRDRRWCQGNLQHARIVTTARGLNAVSRMHMFCGIAGYVAAPLWLALVAAAAVFGPGSGMLLPFAGALALLLVQKIAGVVIWARRRPGVSPRLARIAAAEILLSSLLAPVIMVRQTVSVVSVLAGHDCGWKPPAGAKGAGDMPWLEPAVGLALLAAVLPGVGDIGQLLFVLPIVLPLVAAPLLVQWLDLPPGQVPPWAQLPAAPAEAPRPAYAAAAVQR
jgi:membrane glycosyltransferase